MRVFGKTGQTPAKIRAALIGLGMCSGPVLADGPDSDDFYFHVGGYLRGWASMNLEKQPELEKIGKDSQGKLSMVRGSLLLNADAKTGPIKWKAIGRMDQEYKTDYLRDLQQLRATNGTTGGQSSNILDNYNMTELREFWAEAPIGDRITVKLGKQQLVWGESDFFHAMDMVNGYDMSWRLFFEGENEEWRKPLIMASTKIRIPEANGMLAAFVRPGLDRCKDIGNTYDIRGGRWFFQPYRGYDLTAITTKDCDHPEGSQSDVTGGVRWSGEAFGLNYSLAWLKTFSADPVANSRYAPYAGKTPNGAVFDLIHPKVDVTGMTVSGYSELLDSVLSAELAYTDGQPYNVGTGSLAAPTIPGNVGLGLGGVKLKNTLTSMLRIDKNLHLEGILGTSRPSFSSIQLFDTYILDFNQQDDLARLFAYGTPLTEHNTLLTLFTTLNYKNDTINPGLAVGFDLTHGGGFAIPSVSFVLDDHWTAKAEADIFWAGSSNTTQFSGEPSQLFGYFNKASQLVLRVTRQF